MGVALNTVGMTFSYCVESTKGTRPTTGYTIIPDIKEIPEMNPKPDTLETTDLSATEYKTYIEGLKDLGGTLEFTANYTAELKTVWDALITAYKGLSGGKQVWFMVAHPELDKAVFFTGQPSALGLPAAAVNSVLETKVFVTPTGEPKWENKPASATQSSGN